MGSLIAAACLAAAVAAPPTTPEDAASAPGEAQVRFHGERLFAVRAAVGKLDPAARARAIEERLRGIVAAGDASTAGRLHQQARESSIDLYVGDVFVLSVLDADATPVGRTRNQLAADVAVVLERVLEREFRDRSLKGVLTALGVALLATLLLLGALWGLRRIGPPLQDRAHRSVGRLLQRLRLERYGLAARDRAGRQIAQAGQTLRWLSVASLIAVYAFVVLGLFPWTRGVAVQARDAAFGAVSSTASAIVAYLPNLLSIAVVVVVTRFLLRLARAVFNEVGRGAVTIRGFHAEWAAPTYSITRFLVLALAAVVVFPYLPGAQSPAFQGVSIFVGVLLSLGSSSAIGNVVAGVALTYMRSFSIGDRVKIAETVGDVVEKNLLVVRIRTIKNVDITIANSMVLGNHIVNYSSCARDPGLILHTSVTIGYDAPWRQVHDLLIAAARSTEGLRSDPAPFVLQTSLDDFYVSYEINAFTDRPNQMATTLSALHQAIQDRFFEAGVEILSPHYAAVRDGNAAALPPDKLPAGYEAPGFRLARTRRRGA